jgi:hypothetical protein
MIVGLDFAFSFPAWFVRQQGCKTAHDLWAACEERGEDWLSVCALPFWGLPGRMCLTDAAAHRFRQTEEHAPTVAGIRPKSVFQIGGAGAVGKASVRGMAMLARLIGGLRDRPGQQTRVNFYEHRECATLGRYAAGTASRPQ